MAPQRSRDLFPLPRPFDVEEAAVLRNLARGTRRCIRRADFWKSMACEAVDALNSVVTGTASSALHPPNGAQKLALQNIVESCREMGAPPSDLGPAGAFHELCQKTEPYSDQSSGPAPYQRENASWPPSGAVPIELSSVVGASAFQKLVGPDACLLASSEATQKNFSV
jgi:hypothetical protein